MEYILSFPAASAADPRSGTPVSICDRAAHDPFTVVKVLTVIDKGLALAKVYSIAS